MAYTDELFRSYWLEYASYYIKERAIPHIDDGLKPVQRRILHALHRIDDGKYHKVANVVGQTMQFHPHGDQSIYGALVTLANKDLLIERQGNFGNIHTGDAAAAARYIECRLTPLAREVVFNKETTPYTESYDGRNQEPLVLPAKIPVLLAHGADGIAQAPEVARCARQLQGAAVGQVTEHRHSLALARVPEVHALLIGLHGLVGAARGAIRG